ncbi:conserved hypothetical protein [Rhodococcus sp. RD6.2]|uniref:hypothetical protein n=1 Tax=Rhodococcus sp. RD6.2 TaxID=260936 RepID=UPI00063B9C60|nr:hypothetical protein [Rhodococcus sp. RD6.2]CRK53183.1 conserved hypothetical protein [Rhodococcus sp. RD6.2]
MVVAIVASGIGAAWVLPHDTPDITPESGVEPGDYVTEPVTYPVDIPGCDEVGPPAGPGRNVYWASYGPAWEGYDDPAYPWLTAAKATAMSDALAAAIPDDVEIRFGAPNWMLQFQPVWHVDPEGLPDDVDPDSVNGDSDATGFLTRPGASGRLRVAVREQHSGVPPCVAGRLDERRSLPDGTVVDAVDTWSENHGIRTLKRTAVAYAPDGSRVSVRVDDETGYGEAARSGALPLTVDELATIAADPGLRSGTAVPAGTSPARLGCGEWVEPMGGVLSRDDVNRLDGALTAAWAGLGPVAVTPDRPIGSLTLAKSSSGAACVDVSLTGSGAKAELSVTLSEDTSAPEEWTHDHVRDDGTRVRSSVHDDATYVTAVRPSGTSVELSQTGAGLTVDQLVALATATGLDL